MFLEQKINIFRPQQFNLSTNTILGTTQRYSIDRTWPVEEIIVQVNYYVANALTSTALASRTSMDHVDNITNLISKINLSVNDGRQPRSVVDCAGVRCLEYAAQSGMNLPPSNWKQFQMAQTGGGAAVAAGWHRIFYRIPMAPPTIGEPLRSRLYLPVHTYPQDPVLSLTFNTVANMGLSVGTLDNVYVDVILVRREPTAASEKLLQSTAGSNPTGYIDWDLIETPFAVPLSSNVEMRFALPVPGSYLDLLCSQYRGGAKLGKVVIDDVLGTNLSSDYFGNETIWRLETGLVSKRQWTWQALTALNSLTRCQNSLANTTTGNSADVMPLAILDAGGSAAATSFYPSGAVTMHDFLNDGFTGDTGNELGSVLDCNTPVASGLKMEIVGKVASVATNPSMLCLMGRRLFGDLSRWQKF